MDAIRTIINLSGSSNECCLGDRLPRDSIAGLEHALLRCFHFNLRGDNCLFLFRADVDAQGWFAGEGIDLESDQGDKSNAGSGVELVVALNEVGHLDVFSQRQIAAPDVWYRLEVYRHALIGKEQRGSCASGSSAWGRDIKKFSVGHFPDGVVFGTEVDVGPSPQQPTNAHEASLFSDFLSDVPVAHRGLKQVLRQFHLDRYALAADVIYQLAQAGVVRWYRRVEGLHTAILASAAAAA